MRLRHLKIKLKHLAAEQRIIRHEERKVLGYARYLRRKSAGTTCKGYIEYEGLKAHRCGCGGSSGLRYWIRVNHLAYGFLRGKTYLQVENSTRTSPYEMRSTMVKEVARVVRKFGDVDINDDTILHWITDGNKLHRYHHEKILEQRVDAPAQTALA